MSSNELIDEIAKRVLDKVGTCEAAKQVRIEGQVLTALKAQNAVDKKCEAVILSERMMITADAKSILSKNNIKIIRE